MSQPSIPRPALHEYAMLLAVAAASRSEDPSRKTGACALDKNGRCIATAYNGLASGVIVQGPWWDSDSNRRKFVIHAEENLISMTQRGEVETVAVTLRPCGPCARLLAAHGVKTVLYGREYQHDTSAEDILDAHGVKLVYVPAKDCLYNFFQSLPSIL